MKKSDMLPTKIKYNDNKLDIEEEILMQTIKLRKR